MRRFFVCFAVLTAMIFMVGCGGDNDEDNDNNGNESGNNDDNSQECTAGEFKCVGSESHYCNSLGSWVYVLSFKPTFSLSTFTFIKRLLSSSSLSAIRVVSSAYLRLLIFLPEILIPACASSSPAFLMIYSAHRLP